MAWTSQGQSLIVKVFIPAGVLLAVLQLNSSFWVFCISGQVSHPEHLALINTEGSRFVEQDTLKKSALYKHTWSNVLRILQPNKARLRTVLMLVSHLYYKLSEVERVK